MKKTIISFLLVSVAFVANAQVNVGGQFSVNFGGEHTVFYSGAVTDKENAHMINLKPKIYWNINEKMQLGGRVGFAFGRLTSGTVYDQKKQEQKNEINRALGWSLSPFFGYKLLDWKTVSIWAEANVFYAQYYNMDKAQKLSEAWGKAAEYGFQILPVINIDLTEKLALQLHLGFISFGWYGTWAQYPDRVTTTSLWDLHKGGFAGLAQGFADYGIGIVRKF